MGFLFYVNEENDTVLFLSCNAKEKERFTSEHEKSTAIVNIKMKLRELAMLRGLLQSAKKSAIPSALLLIPFWKF